MSQNRVARTGAKTGDLGVRPRRTSEGFGQAPRPASPPRPRTPQPAHPPQRSERPERLERPGRAAAVGRPRGAGARPGAASGTARGGAGGGAGTGVTLLTGLGVALLLSAASALGALLDLFLVGGPDWALTALFVAACGYSAVRVRPADRFAALVAPPLAFAAAVILLAVLMPSTLGHGPLGLTANTFELLATKAKALYCGTALTAVILLGRTLRRHGRR